MLSFRSVRYRVEILNHVDALWSKYFGQEQNQHIDDIIVLGVHMRGTDKAAHRRKVLPEEYLEYIHQFVHYYGAEKARIFVATDDAQYLFALKQDLEDKIKWYAQSEITRSDTRLPVFRMESVSKYDLGKQVISDILLLSRCDWFIHSASAVAEAVFYNNLELHHRSVHLEYVKNRQRPVWFASDK